MTIPGGNKSKEIQTLIQNMEAFNEVTAQLQNSYDELQERVKKLDLELSDKNEELEKNLAEKERVKNYLNDILESQTNGVIVVDRKGIITTYNKTAGTLTGIKPRGCLGKTLEEVFPLFGPIVTRLGNNRGETISEDKDIRSANGEDLHVRVSASPVWDNHGGQIGTILILQDMTEFRRMEEFAQRNQRLREMGEMAAGIAHEIRNPLGSIELFASLLIKDLEGDTEKENLVKHIQAGVQNMDRIISTLLLFAKSAQPSRQQCDINSLLTECLEGINNVRIPENINVIRKYGQGTLLANGDRELLRQVFPNLINNAVQAMPDGGVLSLITEKSSVSASPENGSTKRQYISVTVTDTGLGMSPDNLVKIFNPFFTTKDKGTGLGLAISHNIIKAHQGTIDAVSEEGKGTSFTVKIPCWDEGFDEK
ncbi:MAG: PAS domain-containing protein [Nitrospinae bacterium]|nr:PAS domain-containing protein [Nitrospinota bacterium]MZH14688.1 PAS domain-containing protein [Nitrospinota bacterium]